MLVQFTPSQLNAPDQNQLAHERFKQNGQNHLLIALIL
jgi:hypothetical protein